VEHAGLAAALRTWIRRHPDDRRYILSNGYDWTYFSVDDVPFFVQSVHIDGDRARLGLSDGTEEDWDPRSSRVSEDGALYTAVKRRADDGPYEARFMPHALAAIEPALIDSALGPLVQIGANLIPLHREPGERR